MTLSGGDRADLFLSISAICGTIAYCADKGKMAMYWLAVTIFIVFFGAKGRKRED